MKTHGGNGNNVYLELAGINEKYSKATSTLPEQLCSNLCDASTPLWVRYCNPEGRVREKCRLNATNVFAKSWIRSVVLNEGPFGSLR